MNCDWSCIFLSFRHVQDADPFSLGGYDTTNFELISYPGPLDPTTVAGHLAFAGLRQCHPSYGALDGVVGKLKEH